MTIKPEKADDDTDALDALESEEKEFKKVSFFVPPVHYPMPTNDMSP